jgi:hypothetical protein
MRERSTLNPIFGIICIWVFSAGFMYISLHGLYRDKQLDESTHRSQGTVEHDWSSLGRKGGTHYHVRYHFADDQNRLWTVTDDDVSPGTFRSVSTGTILPVKYLADDPSQSRIDWPNETQYHWHNDKVLFYIALGLAVICVLVTTGKRR